MNGFATDLRHALRMLGQDPAFTFLAIIALALGIGLTTATFGMVNGLIIKTPPYPHYERIVELYQADAETGVGVSGTTAKLFRQLDARQTSFQHLGVYYSGTVNYRDERRAVRLSGAFLTEGVLPTLGLEPILGTTLDETDQTRESLRILISHRLWENRYQLDPAIIGREVIINGETATITGVMPEGFQFPSTEDLWIPLRTDTNLLAGIDFDMPMIGMLADGITLEMARAEIDKIAHDLHREKLAARPPEESPTETAEADLLTDNRNESDNAAAAITDDAPATPAVTFALRSNHAEVDMETKRWIWLIFATVIAVLVIGCINVANLQLTRASRRSQEFAIRAALGAPRSRLIGQILIESLFLAGVGAMGGLILASWYVEVTWSFAEQLDTPTYRYFGLDQTVYLFTCGITLLSALLAGALPAWHATKIDLGSVLKSGTRTHTDQHLRRFHRVLAVVQIGISCALLIGAGLATRSLIAVMERDPGFDPAQVLSLRLGIFSAQHTEPQDWQRIQNELDRALQHHPELEAVGWTSWIALPTSRLTQIHIQNGQTAEDFVNAEGKPHYIQLEFTAGNYLDTLGLELIDGRPFTAQDSIDHPRVGHISADLAEALWPGENPLGKEIIIPDFENTKAGDLGSTVTIVGITPRVEYYTAWWSDKTQHFRLNLPLSQQPMRAVSLFVRGKPGIENTRLVEIASDELHKVDPTLAFYFVKTLEKHFLESAYLHRINAASFTDNGLAAIFLTALGIYGVMAFSVQSRRREIGIRMALGADRKSILRLVLKQGLWQLLGGITLGLLLTLLLSQSIFAELLYGVSVSDYPTYILVILLLSVVTFISLLSPAIRAITLPPLEALRHE